MAAEPQLRRPRRASASYHGLPVPAPTRANSAAARRPHRDSARWRSAAPRPRPARRPPPLPVPAGAPRPRQHPSPSRTARRSPPFPVPAGVRPPRPAPLPIPARRNARHPSPSPCLLSRGLQSSPRRWGQSAGAEGAQGCGAAGSERRRPDRGGAWPFRRRGSGSDASKPASGATASSDALSCPPSLATPSAGVPSSPSSSPHVPSAVVPAAAACSVPILSASALPVQASSTSAPTPPAHAISSICQQQLHPMPCCILLQDPDQARGVCAPLYLRNTTAAQIPCSSLPAATTQNQQHPLHLDTVAASKSCCYFLVAANYVAVVPDGQIFD
ncbi:hypothetical protein U9M48_028701 [Paspalum notatum var. saurae]